MHRHRQRAGRRIAGSIRYRNADGTVKAIVCSGISSSTRCPLIRSMRLIAGEFIGVVNSPLTGLVILRGARHLHLDAVHRQCCVVGKPIRFEIFAVDQAHSNGWCILPCAVLQRNGAVFAVQIHGKGTSAEKVMGRMLTGTVGKGAFVHHDLGFVLCRCYLGLVLIPLDGDGQRRLRRITVRIRDGVGEVFLPALAIRHIHLFAKLVGIGAVRVQHQRAELTLHGLAQRSTFN